MHNNQILSLFFADTSGSLWLTESLPSPSSIQLVQTKLSPGALPPVRRQINAPCPLRRDCNANKQRTAEQRGGFDLPSAFVNITMVVWNLNKYIFKWIHTRAPSLPLLNTPFCKHFSIKEPRRETFSKAGEWTLSPRTTKPRQNYPPLLNNIDSWICKRRMFFCFFLTGGQTVHSQHIEAESCFWDFNSIVCFLPPKWDLIVVAWKNEKKKEK